MQQLAALRPLVTAGAAAVGASVIALTPAISNDLAADLQHSAAALQQRAVELTDYVANPIQTWIDTFEAAGINLQSLVAQFQQHPFPVPQQLAANFLQYGVQYVKPFTTVTSSAVSYYLGTGTGDFVPTLQTAAAAAAAGNISTAVTDVYDAVYGSPIISFGEPLETIPQILNPITQNLANTSDYLTTTALTNVGLVATITLPVLLKQTLGTSLQNVYNSFAAGDPAGGLINAVDIPGELTNAFLNGKLAANGTYGGGLLSDGASGIFKTIGITTAQGLAEKIVAPNAQNIMTGGSLSYALGYLLNLVTNGSPNTLPVIPGFPTPQTIVDNLVNLLQYLFANPGAAAAATSPAAGSIVGAFNPADVLNGGSAMASLAAELPGLSADVGNIAGHLGADLASVLPGMILSVLHF